MRAMGVRGLLIYCSDYHCSHSVLISGDRWPDHVRLSDLEPLFVCQACGTRPAELRPDFDAGKKQDEPTAAERLLVPFRTGLSEFQPLRPSYRAAQSLAFF